MCHATHGCQPSVRWNSGSPSPPPRLNDIEHRGRIDPTLVALHARLAWELRLRTLPAFVDAEYQTLEAGVAQSPKLRLEVLWGPEAGDLEKPSAFRLAAVDGARLADEVPRTRRAAEVTLEALFESAVVTGELTPCSDGIPDCTTSN